jgi:hypothetical protein
MNPILKVILIEVTQVLFTIVVNYLYFYKIFLGKKLDLTGYKGGWAVGGAVTQFLLLFYILFCLKQYIFHNEFYDRTIQIIAFSGLYLSMITIFAIGLRAMKSR